MCDGGRGGSRILPVLLRIGFGRLLGVLYAGRFAGGGPLAPSLSLSLRVRSITSRFLFFEVDAAVTAPPGRFVDPVVDASREDRGGVRASVE